VRLVVAAALSLVCACNSSRDHEVVLWHSYTGSERTALETTAARWNAEHPGTPLVLVAVPHDAFADKISSAVPRGNGPDLFIYAQDRIGDWADAGVIEPIEFWAGDGHAERFGDQALGLMAYRGSLWGLPLAEKSLALFYRSDLVPTPPATTDDLVALHVPAGCFPIAYATPDLYVHAVWLHGFGGRVFDDHGKLAIASPEAARALEFARDLVARRIAPQDEQNSRVVSMFNEGKAATMIQGPWAIQDIATGVPWQVAPLPIVSATGRPAAPFLGAEGILMSARAHDKDAAFAVMDALTGDDAATVRAKAHQVVANHRAYDDPEVARDAVLRAFRTQVARTVPMPSSGAMRQIWTPYRTALGEVLAGRADPTNALADLQDEVRRYVERK
jgi:arabinogalactan oligomer/maltooligosaccharide transport system substrate-binding protein